MSGGDVTGGSGASARAVIAIDGPAASGKSSVSRELARRLGYVYVNTGAMYRAVTWLVLRAKEDPSDAEAVERLLNSSRLEAGVADGQSCFLVDGADPGEALVGEAVNGAVSKIAALPSVRRRLVEMQRQYGERCDSVMEGRDIGSAVFPGTPHKFYVDASVEVRVARRLGQGITDSVALRDAMDSARKDSPLMIPADAVLIDSSHKTVGQVVEELLVHLKPRGIVPVAD